MMNDDSSKYEKLSDIEHILHAPDTYIGSVETNEASGWIFDGSKMTLGHYSWIPGLYKCFDEGIVNARDHYIRMGIEHAKDSRNIPVKNINITICRDTGSISIYNDGNGIDVIKHSQHGLWIPEMIFGHLRTSTNYDKKEKKIVGGKNGFGFKLVLIYSSYGKVETVDHKRGLKYVQEFKNNLGEICPPKITKAKCKPYTKVTFVPDFARFYDGQQCISSLSDFMFNLLKKTRI
jgi:DNA topoisomerase-2